MLVHRLAGHPSRTLRPAEATVCVVASPMAGDRDHAKAAMRGSGCSHPSRVRARLLALGEDVCPGRPVAVIDGPDADGSKTFSNPNPNPIPNPNPNPNPDPDPNPNPNPNQVPTAQQGSRGANMISTLK